MEKCMNRNDGNAMKNTKMKNTKMKITMGSIRNSILTGILTGSVCLTAVPAFAQDVTIEGPACTFHVLSSLEEGAETEEKEVQAFQLFGRAGEDRC